MKKTLVIGCLALTMTLLVGCSTGTQTATLNEPNSAGRLEQIGQVEQEETTSTTKQQEVVQTETTSSQQSMTIEQETATTSKTKRTKASTSKAPTAVKTSAKKEDFLSKEEVKRIALERVGVSEDAISRYKIELDYDDDARRWEYEIGFYVGAVEYDLEIHAQTGKVIRVEKEEERVVTTTSKTSNKASISKVKAKEIALERAGVSEKEITRYEVEMDYDDDTGRWEYEISFSVGHVEYDVTIDGNTGRILEYEKDVD